MNDPTSSPDALSAALEQAVRASALQPAGLNITNTLGVALYRAERFEEAIATLVKSDEQYAKVAGIDATPPPPQQPGNWAFLAMAHHQLGHADEARVALGNFRELMKEPKHANDEESRQFLQEAEALIGEHPARGNTAASLPVSRDVRP